MIRCRGALRYSSQKVLQSGSCSRKNLPAGAALSAPKYRELRDELLEFLSISQQPLRLVYVQGKGGNGEGVITYLPKVPDELRRIVILDASYLIREVE